NAYVAGTTQSADFPTFNAFQSSLKQHTCTNPNTGQPYQCGEDAFVAELNATGNALYYSSFLGGSGNDAAYGIRVDTSGNAYVAGTTDSTDFPTANAYQATLSGQTDAFITKISATSGPAGLPFRITSFTPTSGQVGTTVTLTGSGFTGAIGVAFNGTSATFTVVSGTQITATVPSGATVGPISVRNSTSTFTGGQVFTELPAITSFSPTSGILGTKVTITGTSFTGATDVRFYGIPTCDSRYGFSATYTVVSDTQISTSVPSGATTGKIGVTNNGLTDCNSP